MKNLPKLRGCNGAAARPRMLLAGVIAGLGVHRVGAADVAKIASSLKDNAREYWWAWILAALIIIPLAYFVLRKLLERVRYSRFRREYRAEKAELEEARKQAEEEYRATGGGPARTYAALGRQLPQVDNPDDTP